MNLRIVIPVLLIFTINGWSSSRFFIRLNGSNVGTLVETRHVDRQADRITIESVSRITLQRGGSTITLSETSVEISRLDGRPVSLSVTADQAGLKTFFQADFSGKSVQLHQDGTVRQEPISPDTVLSYGSEKKIAGFLKSKDISFSFPFFSSDTMGVVTRRIRKLKKEKKHSGTSWRLEVDDVSGKTNLKQEMLVGEAGRPLVVRSQMMGLTIEFVSDKRENSSEAGNGKKPDILIQTLFRAKQWFPSGMDVQATEFFVAAGEEPLSIMKSHFQSVLPRDNGSVVTRIRPELTDNMQPDTCATALRSGPIVQTELPEIQKIARDLKKNAHSPADFVRKVVHKVYRMIDKKGYGVGFADTASILKNREGDCTEHTVLALALLRAGGIPCRAAAGVVAVNGTIGYHMWVQVGMGGKWVPIDPTLDEETADPSHLLLAHTLLNNTSFQRDLLPIVQQIGALSVTPLSVTFRDKAVFTTFGVCRIGRFLNVNGIGLRLNPGDDFKWTPAEKQDEAGQYSLGTMSLRNGMQISISLADVKSQREITRQAESLISNFAPRSMETILDIPVVVGQTDRKLAMVVAHRGTLFRFTFSAPSATMETELKEKAYNICLKLLANVKRTDSDR